MTISELQAFLPEGQASMFMRVMDVLDNTLITDRRHDLLTLLHGQLLPVLVTALDLLTVADLVVATGAHLSQVRF